MRNNYICNMYYNISCAIHIFNTVQKISFPVLGLKSTSLSLILVSRVFLFWDLVEAMLHFWNLSQTFPFFNNILASHHCFLDFTDVVYIGCDETILLIFCQLINKFSKGWLEKSNGYVFVSVVHCNILW